MVVVLSAIIGSLLSAWHGGAFNTNTPKVLKNILWALPFAFVVFTAFHGWVAYLCAFVAFALCAAGKATGHGGWIDVGTWLKPREDERLEFLIRWLHDDIQEKHYDLLGLMLLGFTAVSGAALTLAFVNIRASLIIALGGIMKGAAYKIGWWMFPDNAKGRATRTGEVLAGAFAYGALAIAWGML